MPIAQGRLGSCSIFGVVYPVYDWAMFAPRNLVQGNPVGNTGPTNHAEGLQSTRFVANMMVREKATEVLAMAFWNMFLARTWASGFDDTSAGTIIAGSGRKTRTLALCKAESFVLRIAKGAVVGLQVAFLAPGIPTEAITNTATSYVNEVDSSPPLMFDKATLGGFNVSVYGITLSYSNNHQPNGPLDGTKFLAGWETGVRSAGLSVMVAETDNDVKPVTDDATVTIALVGAATRTITVQKVTSNNPRDGAVNPGQVYLTQECIVDETAAAPVVSVA